MVAVQPGEQWAVERALRLLLKEAFEEASVEIPFPRRVVYARPEDGGGDGQAHPTRPRDPYAAEAKRPSENVDGRQSIGEFRASSCFHRRVRRASIAASGRRERNVLTERPESIGAIKEQRRLLFLERIGFPLPIRREEPFPLSPSRPPFVLATVLRHRWKQLVRGASVAGGCLQAVAVLVMGSYLVIAAVVLGAVFPAIAERAAPQTSPAALLNGSMLAGLLALVGARFFLQSSTQTDLRPFRPSPLPTFNPKLATFSPKPRS